MNETRHRTYAVLGASIFVVAACSGASNQDLFAAEGTSSFTDKTEPAQGGPSQLPSDDGKGSSSGSSGASGSSSGGSSGASGSSSGGSSGASGSSSGSSGASGSSSGSSGASGSSSGGSSSGGPLTPEIYCGKENGNPRICAGGSSCCAKRTNGGALQYACVPPTGAGGVGQCTGALIRCDSAADCTGGQVCCGSFEQTFGYKSVQCQPQCVTQIPGVTMVQMCDPAAAVDECAAKGLQCEPSGSLIGFFICK